ncbi:MAG TPA: hypothetical protein VI357_04085 [Mycobacteriales bacterium]
MTVDVTAFEAAAEAAVAGGDPAAALALAGDELLPGEPYASWAFQPRQRVDLLRRGAAAGLRRWEELVALDPTDEQAHLGAAQDLLAPRRPGRGPAPARPAGGREPAFAILLDEVRFWRPDRVRSAPAGR